MADTSRSNVVNANTVNITPTQAYSIDIVKVLYSLCNAVSGSWSSFHDSNRYVIYNGHICIWSYVGSGTQTISIPPCESMLSYMATLLTETGCQGVLIRQGLAQVTISMPDNTPWQLTGMFYINTKD